MRPKAWKVDSEMSTSQISCPKSAGRRQSKVFSIPLHLRGCPAAAAGGTVSGPGPGRSAEFRMDGV